MDDIEQARVNRTTLINKLRNDPPSTWDFCRVDHCAFGVCNLLGIDYNMLGLSDKDMDEIFGVDSRLHGIDEFYSTPKQDVTPAQVADALAAAQFAV